MTIKSAFQPRMKGDYNISRFRKITSEIEVKESKKQKLQMELKEIDEDLNKLYELQDYYFEEEIDSVDYDSH